MQIVNTTTGEIITRQELVASLRTEVDGKTTEVSLPRDLTGVDLSEFGAALVEPTEPPEGNAVPDGAELVDGVWRQKWRVEPIPIHVPQSVTMRQAQLALLAHDLLDDVEAAIAASGRAAQIEWNAAKDVYRDSPLALAMASVLELDEPALDALFIEAATL